MWQGLKNLGCYTFAAPPSRKDTLLLPFKDKKSQQTNNCWSSHKKVVHEMKRLVRVCYERLLGRGSQNDEGGRERESEGRG